MLALVLDTETTSLSENRTIKLERQPSIIEFYSCLADLSTGAMLEELDLLIKPPKPLSDRPEFGSKKTVTEITGLTNEQLANAPSFKEVADLIISAIEAAPLVISHNYSFDQEVLNIEAERLGRIIKWPRGLCSVEQSIFLKGKRLTLSALHEHLFGEKFADAHRAKADVQALVRCCTEMFKRGML